MEGADSEGLPFSFLKEVSDDQLKTVIQSVSVMTDLFHRFGSRWMVVRCMGRESHSSF